MKIGVLAMQGAFEEHIESLKSTGVETIEVRTRKHLKNLDGLIIPGGESTTICKMLKEYDMLDPIRRMGNSGFPIFGTCAGMIILSSKIEGDVKAQPLLELLDVTVVRNAFGRQVNSFEADLEVPALGEGLFHGVFIRAPIISQIRNNTRALSRYKNNIVAVEEGNLLATAFHPELTNDNRFHKYFIEIVKRWKEKHGKN